MEDKKTIFYRKIGENISNLRQQSGMTRRELAEKMKIRNSYLKRIEKGKARKVKFTIILVLAKILKIKLSDVFEDT